MWTPYIAWFCESVTWQGIVVRYNKHNTQDFTIGEFTFSHYCVAEKSLRTNHWTLRNTTNCKQRFFFPAVSRGCAVELKSMIHVQIKDGATMTVFMIHAKGRCNRTEIRGPCKRAARLNIPHPCAKDYPRGGGKHFLSGGGGVVDNVSEGWGVEG